jgi:type I restriction enzyme S subunit
MKYEKVLIENLLSFTVGGGWGEDIAFENSTKVSVIRGTDFANIFEGDISEVPVRFEKTTSVLKRKCKPNDVILEISGGSASKGQYVGRVLFVTEEILNNFEHTVIPASFCRLIRFDETKIIPRYAYFYLKKIYLNETISMYEVQSTGISNFQFTDFIKSETIPIPPIEEQRKIVELIGNIEDFSFNVYQEARNSRSLVDLLINKHVKE